MLLEVPLILHLMLTINTIAEGKVKESQEERLRGILLFQMHLQYLIQILGIQKWHLRAMIESQQIWMSVGRQPSFSHRIRSSQEVRSCEWWSRNKSKRKWSLREAEVASALIETPLLTILVIEIKVAMWLFLQMANWWQHKRVLRISVEYHRSKVLMRHLSLEWNRRKTLDWLKAERI